MTHHPTILLVDMQSFYANLEKVRNPSLASKPIVVAGDPNIRSGVILAACPLAKTWGVETAEPLWQAEQKCSDLVVVRPRMEYYLHASIRIAEVLEGFAARVEPYSVDEIFVDISGSPTPFALMHDIQQTVERTVGVAARIGCGSSKVLAKMSCDHFAKKHPDGVFQLTEENLKEKLWPRAIEDLFGVGRRMARNLRNIGIRTIGQLARTPVEELRYQWGINGEVLWRHAHGIDDAPVTPDTHIRRQAIGHHMTLPRDYKRWEEIRIVLRELSEEVARRVRANGYSGDLISVSSQGGSEAELEGFQRQFTLPFATDDGQSIYNKAASLFQTHWQGGPVRSLGVSLGHLSSSRTQQLNLLFTIPDRHALNTVRDQITSKYGPAALINAASLQAGGQAKHRAEKIGGHYK
ncbi:DNA polymerase IV [Salsuginibacillus kocurii]|uniref:DNA polymerase IV n=1 Tax=Salsuginibacillus kocurii TaxID=427078 RepID=UPI00035D1B66|nr:DNA polymerase IV [Salsuginibacillus kocurii]